MSRVYTGLDWGIIRLCTVRGDEDTYDVVCSFQVRSTRILAGHRHQNGVCSHGRYSVVPPWLRIQALQIPDILTSSAGARHKVSVSFMGKKGAVVYVFGLDRAIATCAQMAANAYESRICFLKNSTGNCFQQAVDELDRGVKTRNKGEIAMTFLLL
uniref:Uncharacterized protein n=1 Tax=Tanacetum cinerariifolium TaxID=118510 RepID=A0A699HJZ5_TANCI|nr:hypothetical protein [Tanacetum cinerariifolium]